MMDHILRPPLVDRHVERIEDELRAQVGRHAASDASLVGNPPSRSDSCNLGKDFPLTSLKETTRLTPIKIAPIADDRGRKETISARNLPDVEAV
jgi:hypothetical protein